MPVDVSQIMVCSDSGNGRVLYVRDEFSRSCRSLSSLRAAAKASESMLCCLTAFRLRESASATVLPGPITCRMYVVNSATQLRWRISRGE